MGTCREIFVFIQQKLAEKTHPGQITITRGRISVFSGHRQFHRRDIEYSSRVNHSLPNAVCLPVCTVCTCMFCTFFRKHLIIHLMSFV